jgi:1-deoxy-D-xylulose-5-phosphate reductoisomerase
MNAANELAVYAFLRNRIGFLDITDVIERTMDKVSFIDNPTLNEYFESDGEARNYAADNAFINSTNYKQITRTMLESGKS